ncbi:hypothetical protein HRbin40_02346 [bacterium HR40]|nr:hypothetical protein HRbin40_02346 [bacterium HR40]
MLVKVKPFPLLPPAVGRSPLVQNLGFVLLANWLCQGMRGMGRRELAGRLVLELLLAGLGASVAAALGAQGSTALLAGLLAAHTLQFLANGQLWVCLRYARWLRLDPARCRLFLDGLVQELRALPWLREAACIGSLAASPHRFGPHSDIDVRVVFAPGLAGFLRTHRLLLRLRWRALVRRVPLDLGALDQPRDFRAFRADEPVAVILDRDGRLRGELAGVRALVAWP